MSKAFTINDPIHGRIELSAQEKKIIDHSYFQRLRRIKALGFLDRVFPSARHSRFEHSIGACHVIGRLFDDLKKVTEQLQESSGVKWCKDSDFVVLPKGKIKNWFSKRNRKHLRLAALLHDVGHGPFSHASEVMMPLRKNLLKTNKRISKFVREYLAENPTKQADHEDYSLLLLDSILQSVGLKENEIKRIASLKHECIKPPAELEKQIQLFRDLVSGEFDSDRMDYLLRDSYFCGVPYGRFDLERLLEGICLLKSRKDDEFSLGIRRSSLAAFEHFLFARFQMYAQIYTHSVDASCNTAFKVIAKSSGYKLPAKIENYIEKDDENILDIWQLKRARQQLRNRKLWTNAFETFRQDNRTDSVIVDRIKSAIGENYADVYERDKPMKKAHLLNLPIVTENIRKELVSERIREVSRMVSDYNGIHVVRRVFVDPEKKKDLIKIRKAILGSQKHLSFNQTATISKNSEKITVRQLDVAAELADTRIKLKKLEQKRKKKASGTS